MKNKDRVVMLTNDGFDHKGDTGTILKINTQYSPNAVEVIWDNGRTYLHNKSDLQLKPVDNNNPNAIFKQRRLL